MIIDQFVKVRNYKCFENEYCGYEKIFPINVIIGKNNSGKSSLLELIEYLISPSDDFINIGRGNLKAEVTVSHVIHENEIRAKFEPTVAGGGIPGSNHFEYGKQFIGTKLVYNALPQFKKNIIQIDKEVVHSAEKQLYEIHERIVTPLHGKIIKKITAERDIVKEGSNVGLHVMPNGVGVTNYIQGIINRDNYDSKLIEYVLLNEINKITYPEIEFTDIVVQLDGQNLWQIYFEDKINGRIALSKMGSGIKTILQVLVNLIVIPKIENKLPSDYVFLFEELENNLHPSIQRRLFKYIYEYSIKNSTYFFITTHSNVVIDVFGSLDLAQIIHIVNNRSYSVIRRCLSYLDNKHILEDLEIKASDLLQCNGIIWVEGPSDRIYLKKWISLINSDWIEGLHYLIVFYGGKLLSNLKFDFYENDLIPLLKVNSNSAVMIDRDGNKINPRLNKTKIRITGEIGENNCWITKGREIENYLTEKTIKSWLDSKYGLKSSFKQSLNTKLGDSIKKLHNKVNVDYEKNKPMFAREIVKYIEKDDLEILDLKKKLESLNELIKSWNSI